MGDEFKYLKSSMQQQRQRLHNSRFENEIRPWIV